VKDAHGIDVLWVERLGFFQQGQGVVEKVQKWPARNGPIVLVLDVLALGGTAAAAAAACLVCIGHGSSGAAGRARKDTVSNSAGGGPKSTVPWHLGE